MDELRKITTLDIHYALVCDIKRPFFYGKWRGPILRAAQGIRTHEIDFLVINRRTKEAHEVEIKTSKADFIKDFEKVHRHKDEKIPFLWFAAPASLESVMATHLDTEIGIILVNPDRTVKVVRKATKRSGTRPLNQIEQDKLFDRFTFSIWSEWVKTQYRIERHA